jgi:multidrug efflux pump subunit AcrA (membrane-fusion protein)
MSIKNYILPALSTSGLLFASYIVFSGSQPLPIAKPVAEPASTPFKTFIAGSGIIEAKSKNIAIGSPLSRLVTQVAVKVGDKVKAGKPLFFLDDRDIQSELVMKRADLAKAEAEVEVARAALTDSQTL